MTVEPSIDPYVDPHVPDPHRCYIDPTDTVDQRLSEAVAAADEAARIASIAAGGSDRIHDWQDRTVTLRWLP